MRARALAALLAPLAACAASENRPAPEVLPRPAAPAARADAAGAVEAARRVPGGSGPAAIGPAAAGPVAAGDPARIAVATVSGTPIELSEMLGAWLRRDGSGVRDLLDDLVLSRIVELEAARLGVGLPSGLVEQTVAARRERLAAEATRAGAPSFDAFVRARLGITPRSFMDGLTRETVVDLMAPRVVRAWLLASERAEVSVIAVSTPDAADRVQAKLAAGQAFADVARELSEDPSAGDGGRMAPVVRGEALMARRAFATGVGEVTGPFEEAGRTLFLRVDARPRPTAGPWPEVGPGIEESLAARPIEDPEYWQWQQAMDAAYEVDLGPFLNLAGEPAP